MMNSVVNFSSIFQYILKNMWQTHIQSFSRMRELWRRL